MNRKSVPAAMVLLATLTLLAACSAPPLASPFESASASPDASASESPSASPAPEPSDAPAADLMWERLETPSLGENSAILDVEAAGPGFVALAIDGPTGSTILTSADGRQWSHAPQPEWGNVALANMVEADGRLIAVGRDTTDVDILRALVWLSDDGVTWRPAEGGPNLDEAQLIQVVAHDEGLVAIGGYPAGDAAGVWTSTDGEVWSAVPAIDSFEHAFMWSIARGGPGFVAAGWRRNPAPEIGFDPAFWTSVDGTSWTLAPTPEGAPGSQVHDVIEAGGLLVAVGDLLMGGRSFAWVSPDGLSWEVSEPASFDAAMVEDLISISGGLLAVGGRNPDDAGAWMSADGRDWTPVEDATFEDADFNTGLVVGQDLLLVGALQDQIEGTGSYRISPMIWYGSAD